MKTVGQCIYTHRNYTNCLPKEKFEEAYSVFYDVKHPYDYIKYDRKTGAFTFVRCLCWDSMDEPICWQMTRVHNGQAKRLAVSKTNPPIIHGKHLFVDRNYEGFSYEKAEERWSIYQKASWLDKNRMGFLDWWLKNAVPKLDKSM